MGLGIKSMVLNQVRPTDVEHFFGEDELIVSRTDTKGIITYCNQVFINVAGYTEKELLGKPHSIIRHPDMPKCVFKFLWDNIAKGEEIFAYVKNMTKDGGFYWVIAHVTPTYDASGNVIGYHSNRRCPKRAAIQAIIPVYNKLLKIEHEAESQMKGMQAAYQQLTQLIHQTQKDYNEFILSL